MQLEKTEMLVTPAVKRAPQGETRKEVVHTRRCNNREICSCYLKVESAMFQTHSIKKVARKSRLLAKGKVTVTNLQQFDILIKTHMVDFLAPLDLATLSMVNRQWKKDVDATMERRAKILLSDEARKGKIIEAERARDQTWSRYMHLQVNCVHKLFVYYTAYKTGEMRKATPQWAFGEVLVDPNEPSRAIMPNAWSFHGHTPWIKQKTNGKGGEWKLLNQYKLGNAPKKFVEKVNEWASSIRTGTHLAVSFQQEGAEEVNWWEAQVWYVWRSDGREEPALVYDAENDEEYNVHPRHLTEYFKTNPTHVVDACETPRTICRACTKKKFSFYTCHVQKGHPML